MTIYELSKYYNLKIEIQQIKDNIEIDDWLKEIEEMK